VSYWTEEAEIVTSLIVMAAFALVSWIRDAGHRAVARPAPGATPLEPEQSSIRTAAPAGGHDGPPMFDANADVRVRNRQAAWRLRC
jgi:hypothetical protein